MQLNTDSASWFITSVQALTLLLPVTLSGLALIMCMRKGWLTRLDIPLDGGLTLGGSPLVGKSKSVRSVVLYVVISILVTLVLHQLQTRSDAVAPVFASNPFMLGSAIPLAYLAGEILNSFVKRRLGIATSGSSGSPLGRRLQAIVDNLDGILASGLVFATVYQVSVEILSCAFVLAVLIHLGTDLLMRKLRLKRKQK